MKKIVLTLLCLLPILSSCARSSHLPKDEPMAENPAEDNLSQAVTYGQPIELQAQAPLTLSPAQDPTDANGNLLSYGGESGGYGAECITPDGEPYQEITFSDGSQLGGDGSLYFELEPSTPTLTFGEIEMVVIPLENDFDVSGNAEWLAIESSAFVACSIIPGATVYGCGSFGEAVAYVLQTVLYPAAMIALAIKRSRAFAEAEWDN